MFLFASPIALPTIEEAPTLINLKKAPATDNTGIAIDIPAKALGEIQRPAKKESTIEFIDAVKITKIAGGANLRNNLLKGFVKKSSLSKIKN